ncbi:extracellular solute-binding protein [Mesobacillus foraminis]|uniref:extracellular solute-binding protein n=1 Tax=Mesobacillus foraminis TaxID=279826 RepID=UPI001BE5759C|nr:extracellular solute-binding protein [Mesobacillus foraminis]MBT2755776.1 extracellular solute-binding protein [Mesobacillus foraminis]
MKKSRKTIRQKVALPIVCTALLTTMAACNTSVAKNEGNSSQASKQAITVMTTSYTTPTLKDSSPALKALEEYTNTDIDIKWVPSTSYEEKFNVTLASTNLPDIILAPGKTPSFVKAVKDGAFWELGPYLKDYKNLSQANPIILENSSINGKTYGIYRGRPLGRFAVSIRKDWLEAVGMETPKTIDELRAVLKAFKNEDPDGNGKNDTTGIVSDKAGVAWDMMQIWFGAPNKWGVDANGGLVPDFKTEEYMEALKFFRELYSEGLIDEDFAVVDEASPEIVNGVGGVYFGVADEGHRIAEKIVAIDPKNTDSIDVFSQIEGPEGIHTLPTSGYSGMLAISKTNVKTEKELKKVLTFLDKLNDEKGQILGYNGIEGKHYEFVDGKFTIIDPTNAGLTSEYQDLNQFQMFIPEERSLKVEPTPLRKKENDLMKANEELVVSNPAESLISEVYAQKGPQLDNIIKDARIKYIVGQIDEKGFQDAVELWHKSGGDDYIAEINKLYKAAKK